MRLIALFSKKRRLAYSFMLKGSLLVVHDCYLVILVILVIVNIRAQSLIEVLVYNFRLFIYLQVIRS
jgi:hypothetical protein